MNETRPLDSRRTLVRFAAILRQPLLTRFLLPVALAGTCVHLYVNNIQVLRTLAAEDGIIEWATAVLYFIGALLFFTSIRGLRLGRIWLLGLSLMCLAVAGEEVSWGQRIIGFETPASLQEQNVQSEFNLHNIEGIHQNASVVGLSIVLAVCIGIPATARLVPFLRDLYRRLEVPVFPMSALIWILLAVAFMAVPRMTGAAADHWLDEVGEMLISIGFFLFGLSQSQATALRRSN